MSCDIPETPQTALKDFLDRWANENDEHNKLLDQERLLVDAAEDALEDAAEDALGAEEASGPLQNGKATS